MVGPDEVFKAGEQVEIILRTCTPFRDERVVFRSSETATELPSAKELRRA